MRWPWTAPRPTPPGPSPCQHLDHQRTAAGLLALHLTGTGNLIAGLRDLIPDDACGGCRDLVIIELAVQGVRLARLAILTTDPRQDTATTEAILQRLTQLIALAIAED